MRGFVTTKLRKDLLRGMNTQGLGRFTYQERMERLAPDLHAISTLIGDQPYLFGDTPTLADFSVAAVLQAMKATPVETELTKLINGHDRLAAYADRVCAPVS